MPHFDFDAARAEVERDQEPITFQLGGESFTCVIGIPLGNAFDLIDAPEPTENYAAFLKATTVFVRKLLASDKDVERFDALLYRANDPITGEAIVDVMSWLGRQFTGRPFEESSDSLPPSPKSTDASKRPRSKAAANGSKTSR